VKNLNFLELRNMQQQFKKPSPFLKKTKLLKKNMTPNWYGPINESIVNVEIQTDKVNVGVQNSGSAKMESSFHGRDSLA